MSNPTLVETSKPKQDTKVPDVFQKAFEDSPKDALDPSAKKEDLSGDSIQVPTTPAQRHNDVATKISANLTQVGHPQTPEQTAGTEAEKHLTNIRESLLRAEVVSDFAHDAYRLVDSLTTGSGHIDIVKKETNSFASKSVAKMFWQKAKAAGRSLVKGHFSLTLKGKQG